MSAVEPLLTSSPVVLLLDKTTGWFKVAPLPGPDGPLWFIVT